MKRRMILILCFALLLTLSVFAVVEAAGEQYAKSLIDSLWATTPENAVGAPDQQLAVVEDITGGVLVGMGKRVCGPLFVYAPAESVGEVTVKVFTQANPLSTTPPSNPVAVGGLGAYDATRGRYAVALFVYDAATNSVTSNPYTGNFQSVYVVGYSFSVDAVGATSCQNGQGK